MQFVNNYDTIVPEDHIRLAATQRNRVNIDTKQITSIFVLVSLLIDFYLWFFFILDYTDNMNETHRP